MYMKLKPTHFFETISGVKVDGIPLAVMGSNRCRTSNQRSGYINYSQKYHVALIYYLRI